MIKFSDIFEEGKKKKPTPSKRKESKEKKKKKEPTSPIEFSSFLDKEKIISPKKPPPKEKPPSFIEFSLVEKEEKEINVEEIYNRAILLAEKIFTVDLKLDTTYIKEVRKLIEELIDYIQGNDQKLLDYVFRRSLPKEVNFSVLNLVNVCILSLELGVGLGYSRSQLLKLGIAAFFHDIGMRRLQEIISQGRKLTISEKQKIQQHPLIASEILKSIQSSLDPSILEIIEQEHERIDGSGYPRGLKGEEISEYAQIIGLVDVYEALTHQRPYRGGSFSPSEAMKIIVENKHIFNPKIIKVFLEKIGMYPKGTFVELNTKEVAQVIKQNPKMPYCPVVRVVYDQDGKKTERPREIDLSKGTKVYIVKSL
jgi:HD-GYP domain-containing protein (c-di-GMP phosphodiesterase class II)